MSPFFEFTSYPLSGQVLDPEWKESEDPEGRNVKYGIIVTCLVCKVRSHEIEFGKGNGRCGKLKSLYTLTTLYYYVLLEMESLLNKRLFICFVCFRASSTRVYSH